MADFIDAISLRIAELLDESVVVNDAEAFKARQYSAEYQIIKKGKARRSAISMCL